MDTFSITHISFSFSGLILQLHYIWPWFDEIFTITLHIFVVLHMFFTGRPRVFMGLKCYTPGGYPLICYLPYKALKGLLGPVRAFIRFLRHSEATQDGRSLAPKMAKGGSKMAQDPPGVSFLGLFSGLWDV